VKTTGSSDRTANLVPFTKNDPRINRDGPVSKKLRKVRKKLEKLDDTAMDTLKALLTSEDDENRRFALGFWGKYRLPVPKETKDERDARAAGHPVLPDSVREKLARLQ